MTSDTAHEAVYERALEQMELLIRGSRPDQLALATPCADWDVRALLNHVVSGADRFAVMASGQRADFTAPAPDLADRAGTAYRTALAALRAAYGDHPENVGRTRSIHLIETAIHAWDLAQATGQTDRLDPTVAETALALARENLGVAARAGSTAFGPEVPVAASAPPYDRLAGFLGRHP
jgi:uncharacterized protein (TIGR03086 family)